VGGDGRPAIGASAVAQSRRRDRFGDRDTRPDHQRRCFRRARDGRQDV